MNFLRRSKPLIRSLFPRNAHLLPKTPSPPIRGSKQTLILAPRFRYSPPTPRPSPAAEWRRSYYSGRPDLQHFQRVRWYKNPRAVIAAVVVGGGIIVTVYFGNLETIPYTKRKHLILISPSIERQLGEAQFEQLKSELQSQILPPIHPDSIRVRLISKQIIEALQRGLRHDERRWSDMSYAASEIPGMDGRDRSPDHETIFAAKGVPVQGRWSRDDEALDDKWVERSRESRKSSGPYTRHLDGLNWEVLVVRNPVANAFCLPGGKIVVFTGLLDHFKSDAEIATVMGHEVGHCVARHAAEGITKNLWLILLQLIVLQFFWLPDLVNALSTFLLKLPFSRRMEIEADHIGLLLMASAGYDPRVAPTVYQKLGQIAGGSVLEDYISTHPSAKKRARMLSQSKVMDEGLTIYQQQVSPDRGIEGFL